MFSAIFAPSVPQHCGFVVPYNVSFLQSEDHLIIKLEYLYSAETWASESCKFDLVFR
jgi:hypothetical protein